MDDWFNYFCFSGRELEGGRYICRLKTIVSVLNYISTYLLLSLGRYRIYYYHWVDTVFITITGSIPYLLLSLGRYRIYYYHWADTVFITITGPIPYLLLSLGRYRICYYHWVDTVFITITSAC